MNNQPSKFIWFLLGCLAVATACASSTSIFPPLPTSLSASEIVLANPISVVTDPANAQIIVANSNVDFYYDQGSLVTLQVDASNTNAPTLTATQLATIPNFAGAIAFDGANAYIPFREAFDASDTSVDQLQHFVIGAGTINHQATSSSGTDPFGVGLLTNGNVVVASDRELRIFNSDISSSSTVDLDAAKASIANSNSLLVENVAVDTVNERIFISNRLGKILIVDVSQSQLSHVLDGPTNTRGMAFDGTNLYAVDGNPSALWIINPSNLTEATNPPEEIDDNKVLVKLISLGDNPNGIAVDVANNRAYVANSGDPSVSVIDLILLEEIDRISLDTANTGLQDAIEPFGISVGTYNGVPFVFVTNISSNNIHVINASTLKVVAAFP